MKNPKKPTLSQKKLINAAGLDPNRFLVTMEDAIYLHLTEKCGAGRKIQIIDKTTVRVAG